MLHSLAILVDSDAFIALAKEDDSNNKKAIEIFAKLQDKKITFISSNYVFAEVVTVLSQKLSHQAAVDFIKNIKSEESPFKIVHTGEEVEELAINIFTRQTSKNISFVDCLNMALINKKNLDGIFSFDDAYPKNGIKFIQDLI